MNNKDHSYPNPIVDTVVYKGKLSKKRPWDEPPRPGDEYPELQVNGTASQDYAADYDAWVGQQIKLDLEGFALLADCYGLDQSAPDFWMKMALYLARNHVKWFQMEKGKRGRKKLWNEQAYALLQLRVIEKRAEGLSRSDALNALRPLYRHQDSLDRRLDEAMALARSPEARYQSEHFEQIKSLSLDAIRKVVEKVEEMVLAIENAEKSWLCK